MVEDNEHEQVLLLGTIIVSLTPSLLMLCSDLAYVKSNSAKRTRDK